MALMSFREPNMVKWGGVRPAHNGTQILRRGTATDTISIMYTVPDGEILYVVFLGAWILSNVTGLAECGIRDAGDAIVFDPCIINKVINLPSESVGFPFWPPIEVPEKYDVIIYSSAAGLAAYGLLQGWVEDA